MMSFCGKSVHSFLDVTNLNCNNYCSSSFEPIKSSSSSSSPTYTSPCKHGLGLITDDMGEDACRSAPRVIESSVLKFFLPSPPSPAARGGVFLAKKNPGGIGFIDEVGGGVDGLMSCTESLGFESSDERTVDDRIELGTRVESSATATSTTSQSPSPPQPWRAKWRNVGERRTREMKKFPPPLSWLNKNGQPSFFLRPVRKDGRLELKEVRIDRPEILRAYRKDGRLKLHLIREEDDHFDHTYDNEFEEEEENYNQEIQQQQQESNQDQEDDEEDEIEEKLMEEDNQEKGEPTEDWKFPVSGEGFRRCNEPVVAHDYHHHHHHHNMSHHHHNLHVWGQHYVTT